MIHGKGYITLQIPPLIMGYQMGEDNFATRAMLDVFVSIDTTHSKPEGNKQQVKINTYLIF